MAILYIYMLPYRIVEQIWDNLDIITKMRVTKENFTNNHYLLKRNNLILNFDSYLRCMIRENCDWIFNFIIEENYNYWIKPKKIIYDNQIFTNYLDYVHYLTVQFNSQKCKAIFLNFVNVSGYMKNKHKKKKIKMIKWTN